MTGNTELPGPSDRYQTIVSMLAKILARLENIEDDIDDLDRGLRPYGDGTKLPRRRR